MIPAKLNRRVNLKPLRMMNGDNLLYLVTRLRDNQAETKSDVLSYNSVARSQMNRQLRVQHREHQKKLDRVRQQQESMYVAMMQLEALKAELATNESSSLTIGGSESRGLTAKAWDTLKTATNGSSMASHGEPNALGTNTRVGCTLINANMHSGASEIEKVAPFTSTPETALNMASCKSSEGILAPVEENSFASSFVQEKSSMSMYLPPSQYTKAFFTASFAKPGHAPPINERGGNRINGRRRGKEFDLSNERNLSHGDAVEGTNRYRADKGLRSPIWSDGISNGLRSQESNTLQSQNNLAKHSNNQSRSRGKQILDVEPCRVYRVSNNGELEAQPELYSRRKFEITPVVQEDRGPKRSTLIQESNEAQRLHAKRVELFFNTLFPKEDMKLASTQNDDDLNYGQELAKKASDKLKAKVQPKQRVASSLAGCAYVRHYVKPSDRVRISSPMMSWRERF